MCVAPQCEVILPVSGGVGAEPPNPVVIINTKTY